MKRILIILTALTIVATSMGQAPQKLSYQAVVRNAAGKLLQSTQVGVRISIIQGSQSGTVVYSETHQPTTNVNGLVSIEIGTGTTIGNFAAINWANGPYFLKSETDPSGGTNYTVSGISQLLSVPYAMNAQTVGLNGFSGDYNELTNKPVVDGSETKVTAGPKISVSGLGTMASPYVIQSSGSSSSGDPVILTTSQTWTVPAAVSKIKVQLWGGAGGGGGAGTYSYSWNMVQGGDAGSGGFSQQVFDVVENQQFNVVVGQAGSAGSNAVYVGTWYGDTDGGNGGDSWFGPIKAAGGTGGKRGSFSSVKVNGVAGTANLGQITGYASNAQGNLLDKFIGLVRSYISERNFTSKPGTGGFLQGYSSGIPPTVGEGGCAIITFVE